MRSVRRVVPAAYAIVALRPDRDRSIIPEG
ncbi:hypothetical protein FHR83_009017 [Actinoplanes campanulatus]|uniref:Uncharacterized protein n=1 Tax=Actinoplanes campanulatus TaxID=113559 RepID=A0A7W5FK06_9ACTN|nr:hypothetical protein [Actinoplanes campanulatus]